MNRAQAIFGLSDGSMSIVGVVLYASGHHGAVVPIALAGGASAAVSMAGGEWLSTSDTGLGGSVTMGIATLIGSVLPALPYLFLHGWAAPAVSGALLLGVAVTVARLRRHREHPHLETMAVLGAVLAVSVLCALFIPGGSG